MLCDSAPHGKVLGRGWEGGMGGGRGGNGRGGRDILGYLCETVTEYRIFIVCEQHRNLPYDNKSSIRTVEHTPPAPYHRRREGDVEGGD